MVQCLELNDIESIESIELETVYDITIENNHNYYLDCNGKQILVHNSSKTFSSIDFIILICTRYETKCVINIVKETYNEFKTTLYNDFSSRLDDYNLYNPFLDAKEIASFKILGSKINFLGADKPSKFHGAQCDYLWFNEPLPISQAIFDQAEMRCKKFWWMDYNPSVTEHWIFNKVILRDDVGYLHTTFKDNPYVSTQEKTKILSYEPWQHNTYEIKDGKVFYKGKLVDDTNQPPPHLDNIEQGTADEFMWKVYGLGLRGAMKGRIYKHITYIKEFPDLAFTYGLDLGFVSDPSVLVKYAREGRNIYLEPLFYKSTETAMELNEILTALKVSKYVPITCDSSDRFVSEKKGTTQMVRELFEMGWEISKVRKTKGVMYWILNMKEYKIHVVKNHLYKYVVKEQENYRFKEVNGIQINQPIAEWCHFFDGSRYAHMSHEVHSLTVERY